MNQEQKELQEQKRLIHQVALGEGASEVQTFLEDWLVTYNEWIISNLKTCHEKEMAHYRNLLLASEAFSAFLMSTINNGALAHEELQQLAAEELSYNDSFYPD